MNDLLELKGELKSSPLTRPVLTSMRKNDELSSQTILKLQNDLKQLVAFWDKETIISGALISAYYNRTIPKSARIKNLFSKKSEPSNNYVKGVRFNDPKKRNHIITYYIDRDVLRISIQKVELLYNIITKEFGGAINNLQLQSIDKNNAILKPYKIAKSAFKTLVTDLVGIEKFDVYKNDDILSERNSYITIFETDVKINDLMGTIGLKNTDYEVFAKDTIYCNNASVLQQIQRSAPYLISMATNDLALYYNEETTKNMPIADFLNNTPSPSTEPTIGVIDTLFDTSVYFSEWVEYTDCINENLPRDKKDYLHGTYVTSIIVDGARINPGWDDECGMFRVRHFGVAKEGSNSSFDIITKIQRIVSANTDIHVWNISLGSALEINENYISPEAAMLDQIQYDNNVTFIVAGTNTTKDRSVVRIGAPADSINSLVVNAIDKDGSKPTYARKGKVLSFFVKPDVCAFGGDANGYMNVCTPTGLDWQRGTSFAAPWIARKMSYLIDKMGLSREVAKALIIDSAIGWKTTTENEDYIGRGIVPTKISDVLMSQRDEIKFCISGISASYYTYTYNLPIPLTDGKFPFYAKAVMCYFPKCTRSQGVDYTNTELDIQFGRITQNNKIQSINHNTQDEALEKATCEAKARELYRKWDNVKVVIDKIKGRRVPRSTLNGSNLWGIKITNKERLERDRGLKFGIVITLKEMHGKNRIREFIDQCSMRGWIVNSINIENRLDIIEKAEEIIRFK